MRVATAVTATHLDALLPQTQCGQCGYAGCRPYAEALAAGEAPLNRCPPGGDELIAELAQAMGQPALPLDPTHGTALPPAVVLINEAACIGCTLCIAACPVDAIAGARRLMHTVITAHCTGCALCLPPCPVDCISLVPTGAPRDRAAQREQAAGARQRHAARAQRLAARDAARETRRAAARADLRKRSTLARVLARAQARLAGKSG